MRIPIYIAKLDTCRVVNIFTHAAFASTGYCKSYIKPDNHAYASSLIDVFDKHWVLTSYEAAAVVVYAHSFYDCAETHNLAAEG